VEFGGGHLPLEFPAVDDLVDEPIRFQEIVQVEDDVVDTDEPILVKFDVVEKRRGSVELIAQGEVQIVIQVGAGGDDVVDEPFSIIGMRTAPMPAGMSAPDRETPTVTPGSWIFRSMRWQISRRRPAL
jgi:hypothetical protein